MRMHFWMVAMATLLGGAFLSGTVPQSDTPKALTSRPTIAEDPPHPEATGWSCDGSNWIFFYGDCVSRKQRKHHHHAVIRVVGKGGAEPHRESDSILRNSTTPSKSIQLAANVEPTAEKNAAAYTDENRRRHRRTSTARMALNAKPPPIPRDIKSSRIRVARFTATRNSDRSEFAELIMPPPIRTSSGSVLIGASCSVASRRWRATGQGSGCR